MVDDALTFSASWVNELCIIDHLWSEGARHDDDTHSGHYSPPRWTPLHRQAALWSSHRGTARPHHAGASGAATADRTGSSRMLRRAEGACASNVLGLRHTLPCSVKRQAQH